MRINWIFFRKNPLIRFDQCPPRFLSLKEKQKSETRLSETHPSRVKAYPKFIEFLIYSQTSKIPKTYVYNLIPLFMRKTNMLVMPSNNVPLKSYGPSKFYQINQKVLI